MGEMSETGARLGRGMMLRGVTGLRERVMERVEVRRGREEVERIKERKDTIRREDSICIEIMWQTTCWRIYRRIVGLVHF